MGKNRIGKIICIIISVAFIGLYLFRFTAKEEVIQNAESFKTPVSTQKVVLDEISGAREDKFDVLVISKDAILRELDGNFVFAIFDNKASKVSVELGVENDDKVEVISGLSEGDEIVIKGKEFIKTDEEVNVVNSENNNENSTTTESLEPTEEPVEEEVIEEPVEEEYYEEPVEEEYYEEPVEEEYYEEPVEEEYYEEEYIEEDYSEEY